VYNDPPKPAGIFKKAGKYSKPNEGRKAGIYIVSLGATRSNKSSSFSKTNFILCPATRLKLHLVIVLEYSWKTA